MLLRFWFHTFISACIVQSLAVTDEMWKVSKAVIPLTYCEHLQNNKKIYINLAAITYTIKVLEFSL